MDGITAIMATISIAGFAIQQVLELLNPLVGAGSNYAHKKWAKVPPVITEEQLKKWLMAMLAFFMGMVVVGITKISLLGYLNADWKNSLGDFWVSALVLGAGTEGMNTLTKYFGYIKDDRKQKARPVIEVEIIPPHVEVKTNETFTFKTVVKNTENHGVTWEVSHSTGGSINDGVYSAPGQPGVYQIVVTSQADPTVHSIAKVTVK